MLASLRLKKDKCSVNSSPYSSYPRYCGGKRRGRAPRRHNATSILVRSWQPQPKKIGSGEAAKEEDVRSTSRVPWSPLPGLNEELQHGHRQRRTPGPSQKTPRGSGNAGGASLSPTAGENGDDGTGERGKETDRQAAGRQYETNVLMQSCSYWSACLPPFPYPLASSSSTPFQGEAETPVRCPPRGDSDTSPSYL